MDIGTVISWIQIAIWVIAAVLYIGRVRSGNIKARPLLKRVQWFNRRCNSVGPCYVGNFAISVLLRERHTEIDHLKHLSLRSAVSRAIAGGFRQDIRGSGGKT